MLEDQSLAAGLGKTLCDHFICLLGDALHVVLCGAGHNIRLLLKKLRFLFFFIVWVITGSRAVNHRAHQLAVG